MLNARLTQIYIAIKIYPEHLEYSSNYDARCHLTDDFELLICFPIQAQCQGLNSEFDNVYLWQKTIHHLMDRLKKVDNITKWQGDVYFKYLVLMENLQVCVTWLIMD